MEYKAIPNPKGKGYVVGWRDCGLTAYTPAPDSPVFDDDDTADWCAYLTAAGASCPGKPARLGLPHGNYGGRRDSEEVARG